MDALTLKALYESQLREELKRPPTPDFNRREMSCMLRVSRGMTPGGLYGHDSAATWVWSDLHLGHSKTIEVFRRPFGTADEMNDTIFRNWEQVVAPAVRGRVVVDPEELSDRPEADTASVHLGRLGGDPLVHRGHWRIAQLDLEPQHREVRNLCERVHHP